MKSQMMTYTVTVMLLATAVLTGCGAKNGSSGSSPDAGAGQTAAAAGGNAEALYKKHCLSCHGDQLQGRVGPGTNLTKVGGKLSREQLVTQIAKGGNGMPGFNNSLDETEIGALADWLSAKK
ncbi:cytochrome c [Paenibacillus hemerocallicola]|uniref:Cytochrome c n=1 Tax=Paenibacillus hemerocallicola TaxID=1172614 RepID=A0A5C4TBI5_9BACL|nr:cytochrome c [Paenibacillus hemerocallicola]TNJ65837.1 cytochrome c [Paenibacillus hemerocallicola]